MSAWTAALSAMEAELLRLAQEVGGRQVLPNSIVVRMPEAARGQLAPILAAGTAELGAAVAAWARREGHAWYRDLGPFLSVDLATVDRVEMACDFVSEAPVTTGSFRDRAED